MGKAGDLVWRTSKKGSKKKKDGNTGICGGVGGEEKRAKKCTNEKAY